MAANHQWPSTCTDTQLKIIAGQRRRWPFPGSVNLQCLRPAMQPPQPRRNILETGGVEHCPFPPDILFPQLQDTVDPGLAGSVLPVPSACTEVHIISRGRRCRNTVPTRKHQSQEILPAAPHQEDRPVFSARVVLLIGDPRPHHFTRVRVAVRLRGIPNGSAAPEITGIINSGGAGCSGRHSGRCLAIGLPGNPVGVRAGPLTCSRGGRARILEQPEPCLDCGRQRTKIESHPPTLSPDTARSLAGNKHHPCPDAVRWAGTWDTGG